MGDELIRGSMVYNDHVETTASKWFISFLYVHSYHSKNISETIEIGKKKRLSIYNIYDYLWLMFSFDIQYLGRLLYLDENLYHYYNNCYIESRRTEITLFTISISIQSLH